MEPLVHTQTRLAIERLVDNPTGSYLFSGRLGSGKYQAARSIAKKLLCANGSGTDNCAHCKQVDSNNHPDLLIIEATGPSIGIKEAIALTGQLSVKPYQAARRVVIISDADLLTTEAQNALLKMLEEPPSSTIIFLLTTAAENLLVTVRSRMQQVIFNPVGAAELATALTAAGYDSNDIEDAISLSDHAPRLAIDLLTNREQLQSEREMAVAAKDFFGGTLFGRFQQAATIAASGTTISFLQHLGKIIRSEARTGDSSKLKALLSAHELTERNVAPRAALERLALELSS